MNRKTRTTTPDSPASPSERAESSLTTDWLRRTNQIRQPLPPKGASRGVSRPGCLASATDIPMLDGHSDSRYRSDSSGIHRRFAHRCFPDNRSISCKPHQTVCRSPRGISSVGRALAWHARGHRFKSGILHFKSLRSNVLRRQIWGLFLGPDFGATLGPHLIFNLTGSMDFTRRHEKLTSDPFTVCQCLTRKALSLVFVFGLPSR